MEIRNRTSLAADSLTALWPDGSARLCVVAKGVFQFDATGRTHWAATGGVLCWGDEPAVDEGGGALRREADVCPYKPRTDVVVTGQAHAPSGTPMPVVDVGLRVGEFSTEIRVWGDRTWDSGFLGRFTPTPPEFFEQMPLTHGRAFGGVDPNTGEVWPENPGGRGFLSEKSRKKAEGHPLPNLEDARFLIETPADTPPAVGWGWYEKGRPRRRRHLGTYDESWQKTRCPLPPEDFSFEFYQGAHPNLQMDGYLCGDESVELSNLTPAGQVRLSLPGVRPRIMLLQRPTAKGVDLQMNLDTLVLLPDEARFEVVWRGLTRVSDLDAFEYPELRVEVEDL